MEFAQPNFLYLLILVPIVGAWSLWKLYRRQGGVRFGHTAALHAAPRTFWTMLRPLPTLLRMGALALGIIALARPQVSNTTSEIYAEGVDIMLVLDISTSMRAEDFDPNRFVAARNVAAEFIEGRVSDRVGLIVFAEQAYTQCPLTLDYDFLQNMLAEVEVGIISDGTAIGTALATAVNRLKDSTAESKVVILMTDGQNNRGEIDPVTAAEVAQAMGVRVYPIGVGSRGTAPYRIDDPLYGQRVVQMNVDIDEEMLQNVARTTEGKYFRATNRRALAEIYDEIGELEKTKIEERIYTNYEERYAQFLWPAFLLMLCELLLRSTRLRRIP